MVLRLYNHVSWKIINPKIEDIKANIFVWDDSFSFENLKKNKSTGTQRIPTGSPEVIKKYPHNNPKVNIIKIGSFNLRLIISVIIMQNALLFQITNHKS